MLKAIDKDEAVRLVETGMGIDDVAWTLGLRPEAFRNYLARDDEFEIALHRAHATFLRAIREAQLGILTATGPNGELYDHKDAGRLAVHLGKAELGQTEKRVFVVSDESGIQGDWASTFADAPDLDDE